MGKMEKVAIDMVSLGKNLYIKVPRGTVVKNAKTGKVIADLSEEEQKELILKGRKRTEKEILILQLLQDKHQDLQKSGEKGTELELILELKLLADVGLVRFPKCAENLHFYQ